MSLPFTRLRNHICRDPIGDWFEAQGTYTRDEPSEFYKELGEQKKKYVTDFVDHFRYTHSTVFYEDLSSKQTTAFIRDKKDCILYNCELLHEDYMVSVRPTLIFSRGIFQEIFNDVSISLPEYIVIDILYKILHFNSDQTDLLNQGSLYYHKCKSWLASDCLSLYVKNLI